MTPEERAEKEIRNFLENRRSINCDVYTAMPAIVEAIRAAATEEREACARWLDAEAAHYIGDEANPAVWQALTQAAAAIRARE